MADRRSCWRCSRCCPDLLVRRPAAPTRARHGWRTWPPTRCPRTGPPCRRAQPVGRRPRPAQVHRDAEKVVLVGLLWVIYSQVLPGVETTPGQLFLGTAAFVVVNAAVTLWVAPDPRRRARAVVVRRRVVLNVGLLLLAGWLLGLGGASTGRRAVLRPAAQPDHRAGRPLPPDARDAVRDARTGSSARVDVIATLDGTVAFGDRRVKRTPVRGVYNSPSSASAP